jgi:hypothetical protein
VKQRLLSLVSLTILSSFTLACRVDNSGLGVAEMPVLPHDSGVTGSAGSQGAAGDQGAAGTTSGTAGTALEGNAGAIGVAGDQGSGLAGQQGAAGDQGSAGNGAAGDQGSAGNGAAGDQGSAGVGAAGNGVAGNGAAGNGTAGNGAAGNGTAGKGAAGSGGAGGSPPPACGPKTCANGCCDASGKCVAGTADDACGHGGAACAPCANNCLQCNSSGACEVDPSSVWDIVCGSASIKATQPNGATWDPHTATSDGTNPDPFCQFEMPANTTNPNLGKSSPTVMDTFTPMWNYDVTPSAKPIKASDLMSTAKTWRLWIGDDDGCSARGCVGQEICEIDQPLEASAFVAGQITRQNLGSCNSVTVKFVCAQ